MEYSVSIKAISERYRRIHQHRCREEPAQRCFLKADKYNREDENAYEGSEMIHLYQCLLLYNLMQPLTATYYIPTNSDTAAAGKVEGRNAWRNCSGPCED